MNTYGQMAAFMALLSITMGITQDPSWFIGAAFSMYLTWQLLSPGYFEKGCIEITKGKVIDIKANGTFLGGKHQPLHNADIAYLGRVTTFKNLPPNFIHEASRGDIIEVKYNPKKPHIAFVNFL
jgi:hypothetical protein